MKVISTLELTPGLELGEHVEYQDKILYSAGTILDQKSIDRLKRYGIMCVSIMEAVDKATTHYERIQYNENFKKFVDKYNVCLNKYKGVMLSYIGMKPTVSIEPSTLLAIYEECYQMVSTGGQLLDYIYNMMPNEDELTYSQSFSSALLCGAFANWLCLNEEDTRIFILCGFYYDIGKWMLPSEILWKPGKLTDEELAMVKRHPIMGYKFAQNDTNLNEHVRNSIIMHHERMDGSGYPFHIAGEKIDRFARYMGIVDTYIAMASPRSFRPAFTPLQILGNFEKNLDKFDISILMLLMDRIADAQVGSNVELSDGTVWEVALIHKTPYSRPLLKNDQQQTLNLADHPELDIVKYV